MLKNKWISFIAFVAGFQVIGASIGFITRQGVDGWYQGVEKSILTPPDYLFGIVWSSLYVLLSIAAWWLWTHRIEHPKLAALFAVNMTMNWAWSFVFFTAHQIFLSFIWIVVLMVLTALVIARAIRRKIRIVALTCIPYLIWISFAAYLSYYIWKANS